eukprot:XP_011678848.1 PREDICTED: uncharacterized protein LOC100893534 isoform X4 [Strongylocentrotus purpuratus]
MKFYNGLVVLLAVVVSRVDSNLEVITNPNATAYRGGKITLPCRFSGVPEAVYWHKHNRTGAPDNTATLVVSKVKDQDVYQPVDLRYTITTDHSLVISDVQIEDETTYSCEVSVPNAPTGRNYTDLTVIVLAKQLHPVVSDCTVNKPGECVYEIPGADTNVIVLRCRVEQVRPEVSLIWTNPRGVEIETPTISVTGPEGGLFNTTGDLTVTRTEIENGESFVCQASGDSVNGTSKLVVTVKYPSEGGLSGGGKAGIVIFVLIVVAIGIGIGIGFFLWRRKEEEKKKEQEKDPEKEPLSPLQIEFEDLAKKINGYTPGSFSGLEVKEGRSWSKVTRLGVFGVTHAGKSSLVRSLKYSLTGDFGTVEVAQSHSIGGVTVIPKPFRLTDHITVVDNRGLKDLDVSCIKDIMDQIRGQSKLLEGTVDFPILVFDARQPVNALDKFLPDFVKAIRGEFGSHPAIVFTHCDSVGDRMDTIKAQATGMGALDQKLYFIENFTETPTEPCYERRMKLLRMLETMMACADENLIERDNKKRRGNGPTKIVSMDMDVPDTTSGSKRFLEFLKRK